ncbi:MAG: hypothetical protein ACPGYL_03980, partial [Rhodospirillaceae bacterium]
MAAHVAKYLPLPELLSAKNSSLARGVHAMVLQFFLAARLLTPEEVAFSFFAVAQTAKVAKESYSKYS